MAAKPELPFYARKAMTPLINITTETRSSKKKNYPLGNSIAQTNLHFSIVTPLEVE